MGDIIAINRQPTSYDGALGTVDQRLKISSQFYGVGLDVLHKAGLFGFAKRLATALANGYTGELIKDMGSMSSRRKTLDLVTRFRSKEGLE